MITRVYLVLCLVGVVLAGAGCGADATLSSDIDAGRNDARVGSAPGSDAGLHDSSVAAGAEICGNGQDDDGDRQLDEGCSCAPGDTLECWPEAATIRGVGACRDGVAQCTGADEFERWGACEGMVLPSTEVPGNCVDEDCDGASPGCVDGCPDGTLDCDGDPTNGCHVPACATGADCLDPTGAPGTMDCTFPCVPRCRTTCPPPVSVLRDMTAPLLWPDPARGESLPLGCRIVGARLGGGTWSAYPPTGPVDCAAEIRIAGAPCDPGPSTALLHDGTRFLCDFDTLYSDNIGSCQLTLDIVPR